MATAQDDLFDYRQTRDFARTYLRTYYAGEPTADERPLSRFLTAEAPRLPPGRFLELGCGPTVHRLLPLAPHVAELHVRDYLDENLDEVRAWRDAAPEAHDWRRFTRAALRDAGLPADDAAVAARERLVRQRLVGVERCDLLRRDRVVAVHDRLCPQLTEVLHEVVDERVVVVDHQDPGTHVAHRRGAGRPTTNEMRPL